MATIHRIGAPDNDYELKAIKSLAAALPDDYALAHNLEFATRQGLPYEYDIVVVGEHAVYHVEVKGYRGTIRGDRHHWIFENGAVYPSPIPLANKKSKILASHLNRPGRTDSVYVETVVLLTEDGVSPQIKDEQAHRVITMKDAVHHLTAPETLPVVTTPIGGMRNEICEVILGARPSHKVKQIGLYNVLERMNQRDDRVVYLAEHRHIRMRPKTVLKVFHYDVYASKEDQDQQIKAIFHDQEALRLISGHPNIISTGDFFAWEDDKFVLPTEYIECGRPLEVLLGKHEDKQITWTEKRQIISAVARGLRHAHRSGVIHRDVRPLNVVVAPGPIVKIVNFDLARIEKAPDDFQVPDLEDRLDPAYVAPEVWNNPAAATPASDVFSLGVVFYELITGVKPYEHVQDVIARKEAPLDLDVLRAEFETRGSEDFMAHPQDAIDTILKMCSFEASERHQSMDEVIEDLELIGD
jgi:tRNA A-37 threonylcarbamoyl transferase component Bud32